MAGTVESDKTFTCDTNGNTQPPLCLPRKITLFDCRFENNEKPERVVNAGEIDFSDFLLAVSKEFSIDKEETFVLATTDRKEITASRFAEVKDGATFYLLRSVDQELSFATKEQILFLPHYDTLIKSGMYEYYASEGQKSLPYAFAELIDNALSATVRNTDVRTVDIRLLFDESQGKSAVVVTDNGCGMTSRQLNNWAVYRLSRFTRERSEFQSDHTGYVRPCPVPRSLNSDISYFGVGGKQAVFYIGQSVRMITRPEGCMDVHELVLSKEEFEKREKNKEDIYCGFINNRKLGDSSHITSEDERFLHALIAEEIGKNSFTSVVVTGVAQEHITFLKNDFHVWTRELAHIYHYYIHGVNGNDMKSSRKTDDMTKIDIRICLQEKSKLPRILNLREITNDMQTLYINSCADTFEFRAHTDGDGIVEGLLRYHPYLYDKETYPEDPYAVPGSLVEEEEEEDCVAVNQEGRGKKPIFECFWNGRLIPYTSVAEFDWCARPKKSGFVPLECFNRISGVLFTNDYFKITTNKLTFMDLELQLRKKDTFFTRVVNGQEQRVKIEVEFTKWIKDCHEKCDKQVKFTGFQGTMSRTDVASKKMQTPWSKFKSIEWDGKTYSAGQYIKSMKTHPILYGTIVQFLLYGDHEGDVYATGGHIQVAVEPKVLFDEIKTIPVSKMDRGASAKAIKKYIDNELSKLPHRLKVTWPEGNEWSQNDVQPAGTPLGPVQVEILNKKGESMTRMPGSSPSMSKKLFVELTVVWHRPEGDDVQTNAHKSQHGGKWPYWFKKMENLTKLGKYTLHLQATLNDSNTSVSGGLKLPSHDLDFSICGGSAERFALRPVANSLQVGVPFSILVDFIDEFGHHTQPPPDIQPRLECSGLEIIYEGASTNGNTCTIKCVKAKGVVKTFQGKTYSVKVIFPGVSQESQILKINLLPGLPSCLKVKPDDDEIPVENGMPLDFKVEVLDEAGNITTQPKLIVRCQFPDAPELQMEAIDCSNTGAGLFKTRLCMKNIKADHTVTATFDIPSLKNLAKVERILKVTPSRQLARLEIYSQHEDDEMVLKDGEKFGWTAGDVLQNLHFRMLDEADRIIPITASLTKKMKVNWQANFKDLEKGKLPNIPIPTVVKDEHFYQLSFQDASLSVTSSFIIVPRPDEPKRMKATWKSTPCVQMGEVLSGDICLEIVDQYGNKTHTLTSACVNSFGVSADGLDKSCLNIVWQESLQSVVIQGVRFLPGVPGPRELCFAWREFAEYVHINVTPGPPQQLRLLDGPEEPVQVFSGKDFEKPLVVQLCDEWGNPSPDPRVVTSIKASTTELKFTVTPLSQPADTEGIAKFLVKRITAAKGEYSLVCMGSLENMPLLGLEVKVKVLPDPTKPVKLLVDYDANAVFPAGGFFTVFAVTVISEDGGAIKNLNPSSISMLMWKGESTGSSPPAGAATLKCSKPKESERDDCFYFRDKIIPDRVGKYTIQFVFCVDKTSCLWSNQYVIKVAPNIPKKLMPDFQPPTPVVSNIQTTESRTLIKSLSLKIMDEYNNLAGAHLNGTVLVSITGSTSNETELPIFEGKVKTVSFKLCGGAADIKDLVIMENCPGTDGMEYVLNFQPVVSGLPAETVLKPFELPFMFYNDSKNQEEMAALTKKKDRLSQSIVAYKSLFDTNSQLVSELKDQLKDTSNKEAHLKAEIAKSMNVTDLSTVETVDSLISEKKAEQERLLKEPRRTCSIPDVFKISPDILGKVAHLAQVEDSDVARVISWHLFGDLDCVVTLTTAAARQIYDDTQGRQQVMPLDSVFCWNTARPLPHIQNGASRFQPQGNPIFARDLLFFPSHEKNCQIVFGSLLGDTILVDNLDAANHYRKAVVQSKMQCPTLLTRQGERVRSNGKFGGLQNKAPPMEKLKGQVFGAPLPKQYYTVCAQIDLLQQYRVAMMKCQQVRDEYDIHMEYLRSPEMVQKGEEMHTQEQQLKEIEMKLGMTQNRKSKTPGPKRTSSREPSEISSKRPRREVRSSYSEASYCLSTRRRTS